MMHRKPSAKVASIGVTRTQLAVEAGLGWLFREQPTEDYGIDAHAEVVDADLVKGRLLAMQIKSGSSWFRERGPGGWWFRPDAEHIQYWINHSLPVVVVLYHPERERCYWQLVNRETLEESRRGAGSCWFLRPKCSTVALGLHSARPPRAIPTRSAFASYSLHDRG